MPWRTRNSRATMSSIGTLPPWLLTSTSLRTPARATLSPISVQARISVSAERVSVPGEAMCSFDLPIAWTGRKVAGTCAGSLATTARIWPSAMAVSV